MSKKQVQISRKRPRSSEDPETLTPLGKPLPIDTVAR